MDQIIENSLHYSVEFIKILLVMVYLWKMHPKKIIGTAFVFSLFGVIAVSYYFDISDYSIIYGIIIISIIYFFLSGKHRIGYAIISYLYISLFDMLLLNLAIGIFQIPIDIIKTGLYCVASNSISLFFIIIFVLLFKKKTLQPNAARIFFPVYIVGGLALSVLLTELQFVKLNGQNLDLRNGVFVGLCITVVFFLFVYILLEHVQRENARLKTENELNYKFLEAQNEYYLMLLQKESETKAFRHDMKEQFMCMRILYEKQKYEELGAYISEVQTAVAELSSKYEIGNDYVNAIVTDLSSQYHNVTLEWLGRLPDLTLSFMDICTLFYNLLKNAFEAAECSEGKHIKVVIKLHELNLVIHISNSYTKVIRNSEEEFQSTKQGEGHGYGIQNIKKCVKNNGGEYMTVLDQDSFKTKIIFPNVVKKY